MLQRRLIALCTGLLFFLATNAQVNMQTGSATFTLPIFNWQDDKSRLKLDVVLSYNSGNGMKVSEVGSNVGQGWNLFAGGVITRMPVGEPDDQKKNGDDNNEHDISRYPDGYLYSKATDRPPAIGCPDALTKYPIYGGKNEIYRQHNVIAADRQLDYFSFSFNGKAGMFVLDPYRGGNVCAPIGDTKMKISFTLDENGLAGQGIRTTITSFTIQDDDGLIYRFAKHGLSKVLETKYCDRNLVQSQTQPNFKSRGVYHQRGFENPKYVKPWVINNWFLTEIEDAFTHRKIIFNYNSEPEIISNLGGSEVSYDGWHNYVIVTHRNSEEKVPVLNSIDFEDKHKVSFTYGKDRIDLPGNKVLSAIDVTYTSPDRYNTQVARHLSRHQINTSYFILNRFGTPTNEYEKRMARLCLRSVKKIGPDLKEDSPPYIFDYYMGSNSDENVVPPPFCVSRDIWGYYNGNRTTGFNSEIISPLSNITSLEFDQLRGLCFLRAGVPAPYLNPKNGYAKNGLLKQVIYPTGGTLGFEYEQNRGLLRDPESDVGGVHVSATKSTDGGFSNNCNNPVTTHYNYVLDGGTQSSLWGLEMPDNVEDMSMYYSPEKRNFKWSLKCLAGCCYWAFQYPGIMSQTQAVSLTGFQKFMMNAEPVMGYLSAAMTVVDIIMVACVSTGPGAVIALVIDVISSILTLGLSCTGDDSKSGTSTSYYSYDLNGASPLPMQFKRVEVVEGSGTRGKTIYEFTSSQDYGIWVPSNPRHVPLQRYAAWAYGLPLRITVKDGDNAIVKLTENVYDTFQMKFMYDIDPKAPLPKNGIMSKLVSCNCQVKRNISQRYTDWTDASKYNNIETYKVTPDPGNTDMNIDFYTVYTGRMILKQVKEKVFKKTDQLQYLETITEYEYNNGEPNYEVNRITTKQSNGNTTYKYIKYSGDFTGGVYDIMKNGNMVSLPVTSYEQILSAGNQYGYLTENAIEYQKLANGDIKPYRQLEQRTDKPVDPWSGGWQNFNGTWSNKFKITQVNTYRPTTGNLIGAMDEGQRMVANIYGYQDKHIIASVINADPNVDKPAYTSFETAEQNNGWTLSATANFSNYAVTGTSSLNLAGNSCTAANLNINKPYILSFWANNNSVTVSAGATLVKSAPLVNGFTYYEYNIAQGTLSVSVSGNAIIDELRLYPNMARMRTATYDPVVGKTAECDENNRIAYYEYDDLARLRFIKDENRNIVKMYEYNNVSKQNGCPGTYYNQEIKRIYTKSCVGDFIGGEKEFIIPANKYSSTISQEDADAKAELELLQNGQKSVDEDPNVGCIPVYFNAGKTVNFETDKCALGYNGGIVPYTVPARRYSSTVPGEVEQMEADDIAANGQAHANDPDFAVCIVDNSPIWEQLENPIYNCQQVNGYGHLFTQTKDINPNSASFGSMSWQDLGPNSSCPSGPWYSDDVSGNYTSNCPPGWWGYPVYISMPQGAFVSYVSKEDANNKARAEAQHRADQRYYCEGPPVYVYGSIINPYPNDNPYEIETVFTNLYTGVTYSFMGDLGQGIPEGAYNVYIEHYGLSNEYTLNVCGFTAHGSGSYVSNVYINEYGCNTFSIYP